MRGGVEIGKMKKKKMAAKSASGVEIWKMKKKMAAKRARWGGDREHDEEKYGGEECEVGWR